MTDKIYLAAAFLLGCCIFSFLNVVIYRLPKKMDFVTGRSACPFCGHALGAPDMVPVLGWVFLGGKCRYCKAGISVRYPLVELAGGIAAVLCSYHFGINPRAIIAFLFLCVLTVVSFVDMDTMEIPFSLVIAAALMGVLSVLFFPEISFVERVIGIFCVSVPLYLLTVAVPGAFGGGDIKLMAACGIFLGWKLNLLALFLGVMGGGIYGFWLLAAKRKKRTDHFAFGPFLCLGMAAALFWGEKILDWYLGFF
ncbi:MAG: prepilin peptidase [Lachnospiraceae bacterium]|jgi:leader peptidase (prepilin peptidase)/N-methyltransferase|nr:prepilin peptidase [Lachnospiraceae bacterium]